MDDGRRGRCLPGRRKTFLAQNGRGFFGSRCHALVRSIHDDSSVAGAREELDLGPLWGPSSLQPGQPPCQGGSRW